MQNNFLIILGCFFDKRIFRGQQMLITTRVSTTCGPYEQPKLKPLRAQRPQWHIHIFYVKQLFYFLVCRGVLSFFLIYQLQDWVRVFRNVLGMQSWCPFLLDLGLRIIVISFLFLMVKREFFDLTILWRDVCIHLVVSRTLEHLWVTH